MKHAQKMVLVLATDSKLIELDQQMSKILKKRSKPDDKIKFYKQALTNFIRNYNPDSHGISPLIIDAIKKLIEHIQKSPSDQPIPSNITQTDTFGSESESDLARHRLNLFFNKIDEESTGSYKSETGESSSDGRSSSYKTSLQDYNLAKQAASRRGSLQDDNLLKPTSTKKSVEKEKTNSRKNSSESYKLESKPEPPKLEDTQSWQLGFKSNSIIPRTPISNPFKDEIKIDNDDYDLAFGNQPALNTRTKGPSKFSEGLANLTRAKRGINMGNTNKKDDKKTKQNNGKNNNNNDKQQGSGLWASKRFF